MHNDFGESIFLPFSSSQTMFQWIFTVVFDKYILIRCYGDIKMFFKNNRISVTYEKTFGLYKNDFSNFFYGSLTFLNTSDLYPFN